MCSSCGCVSECMNSIASGIDKFYDDPKRKIISLFVFAILSTLSFVLLALYSNQSVGVVYAMCLPSFVVAVGTVYLAVKELQDAIGKNPSFSFC